MHIQHSNSLRFPNQKCNQDGKRLSTYFCGTVLSLALVGLFFHIAFVRSARASDMVNLQGRVIYSNGEPAAGVTVTLTKRKDFDASFELVDTDSDGHYSFQEEPGCATVYELQAKSSEIVDDLPLPPSNQASSSGCILSDVTYDDLIIVRPYLVNIGGRVFDQEGSPIDRLTITMTRGSTTATTATNADGHYSFQSYSRCGIALEMRASSGGQVLQGGAGTSGCILADNDGLDFTINFDGLNNAGKRRCTENVGRPVDVTSGNTYLEQTDYQLPAAGQSISIARTYNSISTNTGMFGRGWTSNYDELVIADSTGLLQLLTPDGRLVSVVSPDFFGQIVRNDDSTYTVTFKDGRVHRYAPGGRLLSLTDRNGNQTTLSYTNGRLNTITDPFGRVVTATTNLDGRVFSLSDSMGTIASYSYGSADELLSVTYPDNSGYRFSYVPGPHGPILSTVTDAMGNVIEQHEYDAQGRATSSQAQDGVERYLLNYVNQGETDVTDALGRVTKYFHHSLRGRHVVTRIEGNCSCGSSQVQTWTYDNQANVLSATNSLSQTTSYTYDAVGNRLTASDVLGTTQYTYNQFGEVLTATDRMGATKTNVFDSNGNLLSLTDTLGQTVTFASNGRGQLLSVTDPLGNTSGFAYDAVGNMNQRTDAKGNQTALAYDARGRITVATDAAGNVSSLIYDPAGRIKTITRTDSTTVNYTYDLAGRVMRVTDPLNNNTSFAYDPAYRLASVTDALGNVTGYSYDAMSNLTGVTDALSRTTNYAYDDFDRPVTVTYPEAAPGAGRLEERVEYDLGGNVIRQTDRAGRQTSYSYDGANRLTSATDAVSKITAVEYNPRSEVTALIDAIGQRYVFTRDALGRVTKVQRGGLAMKFKYDAGGNQVKRTDYNGAVTHLAYNALNNLHKITYPDAATVIYTYDKLERLKTATNENGTVDVKYDNMSRVKSVTDVFGREVEYKFDDAGNRTRTLLDSVAIATYRYDADNRLTKILDSTGAAFTLDYDAVGRLTQQKAPNSVKTAYQYDGLDRLTRLTSSKGAATLMDLQYQFNAVNNITRMTEGAGVNNFGYDALDRLVSASHPNQTNETYSYDDVGNRTVSAQGSYSYQAFNRLTGANSSSMTYDPDGNLLSKTTSAATTQYTWDFENRLKRASLPNGNVVTFKYDALGRRIERNAIVGSSSATTRFVYDGADVVRDVDATGATQIDYVNGPGVDNKLRQTTPAAVHYFVQDHLGSTRALTNASGSVVASLAYDSFGNVVAGSAPTRYTYTGREIDPDIGLYYYRARWYDPQVGRFISEDPIGFGGGLNWYAYAGNNPVNRVDPSGTFDIDVHYYLTYYLARRSGCFEDWEARLIAEGDQRSDEDDDKKPGWGDTITPLGLVPDYPQRARNANFHAFGTEQQNALRSAQLLAQAHGQRSEGFFAFGTYLHFTQDSYSHAPFKGNTTWGQFTSGHSVDHTSYNPGQAMDMARATLDRLRAYGKFLGCDCNGDADWDVVRRFIDVGYHSTLGDDVGDLMDIQLAAKIKILDVSWRSGNGR